SASNEISAQRRHPGRKMPMTKKRKTSSNKSGKRSPSNAMTRQRPGCMKAFAQASRKRMTVMMFSTMNTRRVTIRNNPMTNRNLQIFFVSSPFQDLFFFVGKEPVALLIDLVEDLVDPLLCHIGDLFIWLSAGDFIVEFIFRRARPFLSIRIEKIVYPVEELVHPDATVVTAPHPEDKKEAGCSSGQVGDIMPRIGGGKCGEIDDQIEHSEDPKRNTPIDHGKDAVIGRHRRHGYGYGNYCCIGSAQFRERRMEMQFGEDGIGKRIEDCAGNPPIKIDRHQFPVPREILKDIPERPKPEHIADEPEDMLVGKHVGKEGPWAAR